MTASDPDPARAHEPPAQRMRPPRRVAVTDPTRRVATREARTSLLLEQWNEFRSSLDHEVIIRAVVATGAGEPDELERRYRTYLGEVPVALRLIGPHVAPGMRLLEVGAGIGLVSAFLAHRGFDVIAIEPAGAGFEVMQAFWLAASDTLLSAEPTGAGGLLTRLQIGVDQLDPSALGRVDLAFSANVLEHVPDPVRAVEVIQGMLANDGLQVHVCPNYAVPYDPHFGIPLVPLVPRLTTYVLPRRIRTSGLWRSINFVTARQLRRHARRSGSEIRFRAGTMASSITRFDTDATFATRHRALAPLVSMARWSRADRVLARLPSSLASPMEFSVRRETPERALSSRH